MGKRTSQLNEITTIDNNDILYGVDVDDLTHSPDGTSVRFKKSNLLKEVVQGVSDNAGDISDIQSEISSIGDKISEIPDLLGVSMYRQALINGNFDVWQRGSSLVTTPGAVQFLADRWRSYTAGDGGTLPALVFWRGLLGSGELDKSYYYLRLTMNGAGTSLGNNSVVELSNNIENGVRYLCGNGKKVTLSFWARSDIANKTLGIKTIQYYGTGGSPTSQEILQGQVITLTSSWKKYEVVIETNTLTGKTFGTAGDDFLRIFFMYYWGSNRNSTEVGGNATTNMANGYIDIAQVQVNAGEQALPFMPNSFAEEYRRCLRYYQQGHTYNTTPGNNVQIVWRPGVGASGSHLRWDMVFPVEMRRVPDITIYGISNSHWDYFNGSWINLTTAYYWTTAKLLSIELQGYASTGVWLLRGQWTAQAEI